MAREDIELVQQVLAAFNEGDFDGVRDRYSPDVTAYAGELSPEYAGVIRGREAIIDVFRSQFLSFDSWEIVPKEFIERGPAVVVPMIWRGKPRGSSGTLQQGLVGAFVGRDSVMVHVAWYARLEDALRAADEWAADGLPVADGEAASVAGEGLKDLDASGEHS